MNESLPPLSPPGVPGAAPLAPASPPEPGANPAAPGAPLVGAKVSVPLFGGHRGGRPRKDGLPAGSSEAQAADREKNAERMRRARERERKSAPPEPLPSILGDAAPPAPGLAGDSAAPPGDLGSVPGLAPDAPVPWDPKLLSPLIKEALAATEAAIIAGNRNKAAKARLAKDLLEQIISDSKFSPALLSTVNQTAPRVLAKWMNKAGISGEYSDEALLSLAALSLYVSQKKTSAALDKLIAEQAAAAAPAAKA